LRKRTVIGAIKAARLLQTAREAGDKAEARLTEELARLQKPVELRRFDILWTMQQGMWLPREARTTDAFVWLRPNGAQHEAEDLVESVLFGSSHQSFWCRTASRPSHVRSHTRCLEWHAGTARALAEAMPYLHKAQEATVVVVDDEPPAEGRAVLGKDAVDHLNATVSTPRFIARARRDGDWAQR